MAHHELKTWPDLYESMASKIKQFDIRKNDKNFEVGDTLILKKWDPETEKYTGNILNANVDYIMFGGQFGIEEEYCIMSISVWGERKVYK